MYTENKRYKRILIILLISGVALIIFNSLFDNTDTEIDSVKKYIDETEKKLEEFLLNTNTVKNVKVIISIEENAGNKQYGYIENDDKFFYSYEVKGVVIACDKADDDTLKNEITQIVSKYLGIGTNKVKITNIKR